MVLAVRRPPSLIALLTAAHRDLQDVKLSHFSDADIDWALRTGLGPLLHHVAAADRDASTSPHWPALVAADLTMRVLAAEEVEALTEVAALCARRGIALTLLKGAWLFVSCYPAPFLRPMRDLDVLVPEGDVEAVQTMLLDLGYREDEGSLYDPAREHHHRPPLVHPRSGIWFEVHGRLFPPDAIAGRDPFRPEEVRRHLRPATFNGQPVLRLSDELQLPYLASHWARSSKVIHGSGGVIAMLDAIYLLRRSPAIGWNDVLTLVEASSAGAHLYVLLSYLQRHRVADVPDEVIQRLFESQGAVGRVARAILHRIIDRHVVGGEAYRGLETRRNAEIVWKTLLGEGSPVTNLARVPWHLARRYESD
jgi:hypothetical protein